MRRFKLIAKNIDGPKVNFAEGCVFSTGKVAVTWLGEFCSMVWWNSLHEFITISVEDQPRKIEWLD